MFGNGETPNTDQPFWYHKSLIAHRQIIVCHTFEVSIRAWGIEFVELHAGLSDFHGDFTNPNPTHADRCPNQGGQAEYWPVDVLLHMFACFSTAPPLGMVENLWCDQLQLRQNVISFRQVCRPAVVIMDCSDFCLTPMSRCRWMETTTSRLDSSAACTCQTLTHFKCISGGCGQLICGTHPLPRTKSRRFSLCVRPCTVERRPTEGLA